MLDCLRYSILFIFGFNFGCTGCPLPVCIWDKAFDLADLPHFSFLPTPSLTQHVMRSFVVPSSLCLCLHIFFYPILGESLNKICDQCHRQNPRLDNTYQLQIVQWSYLLKSILTQHFCPFCPAAFVIPLMTSIDPSTD